MRRNVASLRGASKNLHVWLKLRLDAECLALLRLYLFTEIPSCLQDTEVKRSDRAQQRHFRSTRTQEETSPMPDHGEDFAAYITDIIGERKLRQAPLEAIVRA